MAKDFSGNPDYPIGMRNNNPGNLRPSFPPWIGQTGSDNNFCTFSDLSYGLRAMAIDLSNKIENDGLDTIVSIITKYAPPSENDTQSYINAVVASTGWDPNAPIVLNSSNLAALMQAQIQVEQGSPYAQMITLDDINQGISMIPQSIVTSVKSFFTNNPAVATASTVGVIAVIIVIILIVMGKTPKFLKKVL